ncbi:MAG: diadenylate cyclase, partial [Sedimentisphaerales bacterium]|nr:diadenylate cyclase [Sedimentisphaerales bacterium]
METLIDYCSRVARYDLWVVAIELVLIGLVVYWVVDFLEGTRGERLFRSVIFILIAGGLILNLVVKQLEFERLQFLYKGFLIFVLIIAVAAFQPEIRRALIRIGQPRFFPGSSQQLALTAEEIVSAVNDLSEAKTGAIIVIEKKVALGEFLETGVKIDAKVTAELLKTIFKPGTALHDMAVLIRQDRIAAAKVQLPLAEAGSING